MNPSIRRVLGILLLVAAVVTSILNLHRVADLGMPWLAPVFLVCGMGLLLSARRRRD
jgi:hypothetical protein